MFTKNIPQILFVILSCLTFIAKPEDTSQLARILAEKQVLNKYLVESKDIVINYRIFNVGGRYNYFLFLNKI